MNKLSNSLKLVQSQLAALSFREQLAFGVCLLERSLSEYFQFQIDTGWLGGADMRSALAQCWGMIEKPVMQREGEIFSLLQRCEQWMPESEDHSSAYASAAINAVDIACNLLACIRSADPKGVSEAVVMRSDTIYLFIQNLLPSGVNEVADDVIFSQALMQWELQAMQDDLINIESFSRNPNGFAGMLLKYVLDSNYRDLRLLK